MLTFLKNEEHYYNELIKLKFAGDIVPDPNNNFENIIIESKKEINNNKVYELKQNIPY